MRISPEPLAGSCRNVRDLQPAWAAEVSPLPVSASSFCITKVCMNKISASVNKSKGEKRTLPTTFLQVCNALGETRA